ncbi:TonB family protein [Novosphingobium colocasiae]|uniref:TonB family protein n=1 Tax=Novosphingobium colocasiae TaxID=1256513 RepID=UPI0035AEEBF3
MTPAENRRRAGAALASALIVGGVVAALIAGLGVPFVPLANHPLQSVVTVSPAPPRPTPTPTPVARPTPTPQPHQGGGGKPRVTTPQLEAPPASAVVLSVPVPAMPAQGRAGTAPPGDDGGSGSGSGGGSGSGSGNGYGSGSGYHLPAVLPRQTRGKLHFTDLPPDLRKRRQGDVLTLRYRIGVDGAVSGCTILSSSGDPALDAQTCALISERFRFRPARDVEGNPVAFTMTEIHGWDDASGAEGR